jgi:hypothetical protein
MTRTNLALLGAALVATLSVLRAQHAAPPPTEVPIGGIILWWGTAAEIPEGFEACDGTVVKTKDAVLRGAKPNLESKFVRGAPAYRSFAPQAFAGGGSDTIALDGNSVQLAIAPHKLTSAQLPAHTHLTPELTHTVNDHSHTIAAHHHGMSHDHPGGAHTHDGIDTVSIVAKQTSTDLPDASPGDPYLQSFTSSTTITGAVTTSFTTGTSSKANTDDNTAQTTSTTKGTAAANHAPKETSSTGNQGQILLDHKASVTATSLDNRPAFVDVVFLIRVK